MLTSKVALKGKDILSLLFLLFLSYMLILYSVSPLKTVAGIFIILFLPGYLLICALFPRKEEFDTIERIVLAFILSISVTSLIGLTLNYTDFGIRFYPIFISLLLFVICTSAVTIYRRNGILYEDLFIPSLSNSFRTLKSKNEPKKIDLLIKIISIIAFSFIIIALIIILRTPPANGYEISIYRAYPGYFWFFIIASLTSGISILVQQAFAQEKSKWWINGLIIVLFTYTVFLLLPEFRGYVFYGLGDTTKHLGFIRDISNTGHVSEINFYPIEHILGSSLIQFTDIPLESVPTLFSVLFSGIYIASMYLLAKRLSKDHGQVLLITAFASPLIYSYFHANMHTNMLSLFMIPSILCFYHKKEQFYQFESTIALLLIAFTITFFHPVTAFYVIGIFITFGLAYKMYFKLPRPSTLIDNQNLIGKRFLELSLIIFITFFMWYFSYVFIQKVAEHLIEFLIGEASGKTSFVTHQLSIMSEAGLTLFQVIDLFIKRYGAISILLIISFIASILTLRKSFSKNHNPEPVFFSYTIQFLVAISVGLLELTGEFVESGPVRIARLSLLMGTILSGLVVYSLIQKNLVKNYNIDKSKKIPIVLVGLTILLMAILSMGSVYNSPMVSKSNHQVTHMDISGTEWFLEANSDIPVVLNHPKILLRFHDYHFGRDKFQTTTSEEKVVRKERLPPHFGYVGNNTVAEAINFTKSFKSNKRYLLLFQSDLMSKLFYPENVRSEVPQWTTEDFVKLRLDSNVAHIYDNSEFRVWQVSKATGE